MRKFHDAIKVKCTKCDMGPYWTEDDPEKVCCKCRGDVVEDMGGTFDYDWKKQLDTA